MLEQELTVQHNSEGYHTETISGNVRLVANWDFSFDVDFPKTKKAATIETFVGSNIEDYFYATFIDEYNFRHRLRISIPNVVELQVYDNYQSGQNVKLSSSALQTIKNYTSSDTVPISAVIESYDGNIKIGESIEIIISCSTKEEGKARVRVNGVWKEATIYVRINGVWKEAKPYIRVNNQWKEGI